MSSFFIRAQFFYADTSFSDSYSSVFADNQYLTVSSENFNSPTFRRGVAYQYYQNINILNNTNFLFKESLGLDNNGATFDIKNLYLPCKYKLNQLKCIPVGGSSGVTGTSNPNSINSGIDNVELNSAQFETRFTTFDASKDSEYITDVYSYKGVVINKAYHKMLPSGDGSSSTSLSINMTESDVDKVLTNNLYINYSNCIILNFKIKPFNGSENQFYYKNLILIENKDLDYIEDFSGNFYYDPSTQRYYLDDSLTECSIKMFEDSFPYLLVVSSDSWGSRSVFHGPVKFELETINDANLEDISETISYGYADICNISSTVAGNNTIACTSNAGEVSINVNGVIKVFEDQQICPIGGTAKTVIAVFSLKPSNTLVLYKDFSAVTSVKADIWGYNFRFIKYFDGTNYHSFKDYGSVATTTISYLDETLDLSKYFSLKEISDGLTLSDSGKIVALTLNFKIYKIATTDSDATDYSIDIPVEVLSPEISMSEDSVAKKIIIKTNYATKLIYRFNEEEPVTVNVTDTASGANQETIVDSTGKIGSFYCKAFNYYYDLAGAARGLYTTEEISIPLVRNINIPTFTLRVKIAGSTKTIYDENRNSSSSLDFVDLTPSQIGNYFVYSNYKTETGAFTFQVIYSSYSSMFIKIGQNSNLYPLVMSAGSASYTLSKKDLFESLDINNQVTISFLADGEIPFDFPFTFLNTSPSDAPVCNAFSLSRVQLNYPTANISFDLSYTYADELEYSIIDQDNAVVYGPILVKERFRDIETYFINGTTRQRSIQINNIAINNQINTLRAVAKVRNIQSATNYEPKIEDIEISSNTYSIPLKIGSAEVILFSDSLLSVEITEIIKGQDFWAFLRIKDVDGNIVLDPENNYPSYIAAGYKPEIFMLESADANKDLDGVISERVDDYTFKFNIRNDSVFNDANAVFQAKYQPIIDSEI